MIGRGGWEPDGIPSRQAAPILIKQCVIAYSPAYYLGKSLFVPTLLHRRILSAIRMSRTDNTRDRHLQGDGFTWGLRRAYFPCRSSGTGNLDASRCRPEPSRCSMGDHDDPAIASGAPACAESPPSSRQCARRPASKTCSFLTFAARPRHSSSRRGLESWSSRRLRVARASCTPCATPPCGPRAWSLVPTDALRHMAAGRPLVRLRCRLAVYRANPTESDHQSFWGLQETLYA